MRLHCPLHRAWIVTLLDFGFAQEKSKAPVMLGGTASANDIARNLGIFKDGCTPNWDMYSFGMVMAALWNLPVCHKIARGRGEGRQVSGVLLT